MRVSGRHVVVTGATRGIGAALAAEFAAAGARVTVLGRDAGATRVVADRVGGFCCVADLADPRDVQGLIGRIEDSAGPIDVLVNNAGLAPAGAFLEQDPALLEQVYRLNLLTPAQLCRQVLPGMVGRGRGHVVAMSSMAALVPFPGLAAYGSSKAGLTQLTAGLRADLRGLPIGTTIVEVGPVRTDLLSGLETYAPTGRSFARFATFRLTTELSAEAVATATVAAVRAGRRHVRLPRRAIIASALVEAPRRVTELMLTGVAARR